MGLTVTGTGGGKDFDPIPEGVHLARCVTVVDLGNQETSWKGKSKQVHKVWIAFEVPGHRVEWEKDDVKHQGPGIIGSKYTMSINERSILGQHLVNWRGRAFTEDELQAFDLFNILDKPCQISVTHAHVNNKTYANISGIMGLPAGMQPAPLEGELLAYTPGDPQYAQNYDKLPEWMQEMVTEGFNEAVVNDMRGDPRTPVPPNSAPQEPGDFYDDIPF